MPIQTAKINSVCEPQCCLKSLARIHTFVLRTSNLIELLDNRTKLFWCQVIN